MGLDITAYSKLIQLPLDPKADYFDSTLVRIYVNEDFPGREAPLTTGWCAQGYGHERFDFPAGSYGGYGDWRENLAKFTGTTCQEVWNLDTPSGPFIELINFADNEGVIGSVAATKLAMDFQEYQNAAIEWANRELTDPYCGRWLIKYGEWRKAFEIASNNGGVVFH